MQSALCRAGSACGALTRAARRGFLVTWRGFLTGCVFEAENSLATCTQSWLMLPIITRFSVMCGQGTSFLS